MTISTPTDPLVEALKEIATYSECVGNPRYGFEVLQRKAAKALEAHSRRVPAEAVAWRCRVGTSSWVVEDAGDAAIYAAMEGHVVRPLYDTPLDLEGVRAALEKVRDRFFPAAQPERDRDEMWDEVNCVLASLQPKQDRRDPPRPAASADDRTTAQLTRPVLEKLAREAEAIASMQVPGAKTIQWAEDNGDLISRLARQGLSTFTPKQEQR